MKRDKIKLFISLIVSLWLYGCQNEPDMSNCEESTNMKCRNYVFPENCKKGHDVFPWLFQQTWFIKPERNRAYFGAIFGDNSGKFWHPGEERDGSYCIDDKTIFFKNDKPNTQLEKIKIIDINETEMVLEFEDGTQSTYYNPDSKTEISPELEEFLKKAKPIIKKS